MSFFAVMELCCAAALLRAAMEVFLFSNLPLPPLLPPFLCFFHAPSHIS